MGSMFKGCVKFNQPLDKWNVSKVEDMYGMFRSCKNFNQPLDKWNISNLVKITNMFKGADAFNQDLSSWKQKGRRIKFDNWLTKKK